MMVSCVENQRMLGGQTTAYVCENPDAMSADHWIGPACGRQASRENVPAKTTAARPVV